MTWVTDARSMKKIISGESGQSLLEIVISIAVVAVIVTALVVAATSSLKAATESSQRSAAVKYAQESIEIVRGIRDSSSWTDFLAYSDPGSNVWCIDAAGTMTEDSGSGCGVIAADSPYTRSVTFTWDDPLMNVESAVSWKSGSQTLSTVLTTYFTQWQ